MSTVTITWRSVADEYPESGDTVLVCFDSPITVEPDGREEMTWVGWCDGKVWRDACSGDEFAARVTHWAERPIGMRAAIELRRGAPAPNADAVREAACEGIAMLRDGS